MRRNKLVLFVTFTALILTACAAFQSPTVGDRPQAPIPPAGPSASADDRTIRFLEDRIKSDPEDFSALNKLAALYLQRLRETGDTAFLELAFRTARASLDSVAEIRNAGGLAALAQAEFAAHDFSNARDHAIKLAELEPRKSYPQGILGDALLELGEYDKAEAAYRKIVALDGGISHGSETRFARLAQLRGDNAGAQTHYAMALRLAGNVNSAPRETIAWLQWQLGQTAFSVGDYQTAEKHYRESLESFPNYFRAVASMGRVRYAMDDLPGAIDQFEKVVQLLPDLQSVAELGDLYMLAGRDEDAKKQYALVEQIGRLSALNNGSIYNRPLTLFYADHDPNIERAYALAAREYEVRQDIYGADAFAWTALKAGKIDEAQAAMKEALRFNTLDARLFYHAGMIELAASDNAKARDFLEKALKLNPRFDPLHSVIAKTTLEDLSK